MSEREMLVRATPSRAAFRGHPIHPMLIPFPIAFLVGALLSDLAYVIFADPFWARASLWLTAAGFLSAVAAAPFGLVDFLALPGVRGLRAAQVHLVGNLMVIALALAGWLLRAADAEAAVVPWGLTLAIAWSVLLGVTGWYGGKLSYQHAIGVSGPDGDAPVSPGRYQAAGASPETARRAARDRPRRG